MVIAWIISILGLGIDFILAEVRHSNASKITWIYYESMIAECVFLLGLLLFNFWLVDREMDHDNTELRRKLQHSIKQLKALSWSPQTSVPIPMTRLLSITRVCRDGKWEYLPYSLLVDGDIIELSFGETSPANVKSLDCDMTLEANQVFRPNMLPMHMKPNEKISHAGKFLFQVQNMPIIDNLKAVFCNRKPRPKTVFRNQVEAMYQMLWRKWIPVFIFLSLISNIARLALSSDPWTMWLEFLVIQQIYVVIPLLPMTTFVLWIVMRTLGNAKIILLFDQLQQSTTPFDDNAEVDEFDEQAPPPTKEIEFGQALILGKLFKELLHMEEPHSGTLFETLGTITVICSVDRVGTIANPVPQVEQMLVFDPDSMDPSVLDLNHVDTDVTGLFEDKDWKSHLATLKPVGLNLLLNSKSHTPLPGQELHHRNLQVWAPIRLASALQACQCHIAREIGFKPEMLSRRFKCLFETVMAAPYDDQSKKNLRDDSLVIPSLTSSIHYNFENGSKMVVSDGIASFLLTFCTDYWDGRRLVDMDDVLKQRIIDFCLNAQENDLETVAYSYSPVVNEPEEEMKLADGAKFPLFFSNTNLEIKDQLLENINQMISNQSFLAITTVGYQPKTDVREFIEDLKLAGIRFVYFSQKGQRESKAFAERLGLETDWNTCILLSSPDDPNAANADGYLEPHDIKAKLPRGIENIRPHLRDVDDIPLHVSLFADCLPGSIEEMMKIYQENGEVVCCFGSSLNRFNSGMFCTADISVAIDPFPLKHHKAWSLGASLFSLPVSLTMDHSSSPYTLSQVIKEARCFMIRITQGFILLIGSQLTLAFTVLLSNLLLLPPVFEGYQLLWIGVFINPLLLLPFAASSENNSDVMKLMPSIRAYLKFNLYTIMESLP